jgi:hypothetical protein
MSFPRHRKIYQSDEPKGSRTNCSASLGDHRSDESSAGYSFVGCSPAEPASASPAATSFSHNPAAVHCSAAKRNLSPFFLSQLRGPLQVQSSLSPVSVTCFCPFDVGVVSRDGVQSSLSPLGVVGSITVTICAVVSQFIVGCTRLRHGLRLVSTIRCVLLCRCRSPRRLHAKL